VRILILVHRVLDVPIFEEVIEVLVSFNCMVNFAFFDSFEIHIVNIKIGLSLNCPIFLIMEYLSSAIS